VVGGGVAGLVAARELLAAGHDIALFEAEPLPGGHANTVSIGTGAGRYEVDTGFVVMNDRNYPNFTRLLAELGVSSQPASMTMSVSDDEGRFEWAASARGLFARPAHAVDPRFHRMLADLVRFNREARRLVGLAGGGPSLREFLAAGAFSDYFVERLIVPQVAAVWSADPQQLWSMPASFVAEFLANHGALQLRNRPRWRTIPGGSRRYVEALVRPFRDRVHGGSPVRAVERRPHGVEVRLDGAALAFDEVVIATHSDQALAMLVNPSQAEAEALAAIPYQRNDVVLHSDERLLPRRRSARASWNYHLTAEPAGRTTITYDMSQLQSLCAERRFLVTLNRSEAIAPAAVIRRFAYDHPVFTRAGIAAQRRWRELSGVDRVHYCGAYWRWGFHEDGVFSALLVSRMLGGRGPVEGDAEAGASVAEPEQEALAA
jgi:hypothetical protein